MLGGEGQGWAGGGPGVCRNVYKPVNYDGFGGFRFAGQTE